MNPGRPVDFQVIIDAACLAAGCTEQEMRSKRRNPALVLARRLIVVVARNYTNMSFPEIASAMGRPNHSTTCTLKKHAMYLETGPDCEMRRTWLLAHGVVTAKAIAWREAEEAKAGAA